MYGTAHVQAYKQTCVTRRASKITHVLGLCDIRNTGTARERLLMS